MDAGFTLLEVLVALAIAVPALVVLYRQGVTSMGVTQAASSYQEAISRAQSHLDALTNDALVPGERNGDDGNGYRWRTRVAPVASTAPPRAAPRASSSRPRAASSASSYAGGTTLFDVAAEVSWPGPSGTRALMLNTRRLGPAVPAPP